MKQHPQRPLPAFRGHFGQRALPLISLSGAALLISLGLLQTAAAQSLDAQLSEQLNTNAVFGGISSGEQAMFLANLAANSSITVSNNTASANAEGNTSIPSAAFSIDSQGQPLFDSATANLVQTNSGQIISLLPGSIGMDGTIPNNGVVGISNAQASATNNVFETSSTANKAVTSIGIDIESAGAMTLNTSGIELTSAQSHDSTDLVNPDFAHVSSSNQALITTTLGGDSWNNQISITGNITRSQALENDASNSIAITHGTRIDTAGAIVLNNAQYVSGDDASVEATTRGSNQIVAPGPSDVSGSTFTISDNQISASAQRNLAANVIAMDAQTISAAQSPLFLLQNTQEELGETANSYVQAHVESADTSFDLSSAKALELQGTITGNQGNATAGANKASNSVYLGLENKVQEVSGSGSVSNQQVGQSNVVAAILSTPMMAANTINGPLTVTGNSSLANASGNQADNTFQASIQKSDGLDVAVINSQAYRESALITSSAGGLFGLVAFQGGVPAAQVETTRPTTITVSDNTIAAQSIVNSASNLSSLSSTTAPGNSALGVLNQQESAARAVSQTLISVGAASMADLISDSVTMSGNTASAQAMQNLAVNTLVLNAGSMAGAGFAATVDAKGMDADYGVYNQQTSSNSIANGTQAIVGILPLDESGFGNIGVVGPASLPASTIVANNQLSAVARANVAENLIQASSTTTLANASFGLGNVQTNFGDAYASVDFLDIGVSTASASTPAPLVTISGNQLNAAASGNAASNVLSMKAGTSLMADPSVPATASSDPMSPTASAGYAVLNHQINSGDITATIGDLSYDIFGTTIGLGNREASGLTSGMVATVSGNQMNATAYGNHAINTVTLNAMPGQNLSASAALVSSQINSGGSVRALVSLPTIGANVTGTNGTTTVANNQITASAVGNMASSSMVFGRN